jgi:hypothetical protein
LVLKDKNWGMNSFYPVAELISFHASAQKIKKHAPWFKGKRHTARREGLQFIQVFWHVQGRGL